jgi:hypothetical protein
LRIWTRVVFGDDAFVAGESVALEGVAKVVSGTTPCASDRSDFVFV